MEKYTGWKTWEPSDDELVNLYSEGICPIEIKENEYLIVNDRNDGSNLAIYKKKNGKLEQINRAAIKVRDPKDGRVNLVYNPRNIEQRCAFDLLHDPDVTVKIITGSWGTGKSMLLVTAALEAIREKKFEKIVWIRNNVDVKDTKDLGSLPGTSDEKLLPFLGPCIDHVGGEKKALKMIEEGQLEIQPLQFLRGRDIKNAIIMCSESENLSLSHIQLILARAAEGSHVWMDGDTVQRDKKSFEESRGIETMIERLTGNPLFGHVKLIKSERSATAALADKLD